MKTYSSFLLVLIAVITFTACKDKQPEVVTVDNQVEEVATKQENFEGKDLVKAEFTINGMTCAMGCAKMIEKKLAGMEGVKSATVDFENKLARVEFDNEKVTPTSLENTVSEAGDAYTVSEMKTVTNFSNTESQPK